MTGAGGGQERAVYVAPEFLIWFLEVSQTLQAGRREPRMCGRQWEWQTLCVLSGPSAIRGQAGAASGRGAGPGWKDAGVSGKECRQ